MSGTSPARLTRDQGLPRAGRLFPAPLRACCVPLLCVPLVAAATGDEAMAPPAPDVSPLVLPQVEGQAPTPPGGAPGDRGSRGQAGAPGAPGVRGPVGEVGVAGDGPGRLVPAPTGDAAAAGGVEGALSAAAQARVWLEAGKKAFANERFAEAARVFLQAFELDPTLSAALYNRAFALRKAGDYSAARDAYLALLAASPGDVDVLFGLAETARALEDDFGAARLFEDYAAREARPERARHVAYARAQAAELAARVAHVAGAVHPQAQREAAALMAAADQAARAKRHEEAAESYAAAAARDPTLVQALYRRALQLRKAGRLAEARDAYRAFLTRVPLDPDGVYGFAETLRLMEHPAGAARAFARYAEIETRPSEQKYVARARMWVTKLQARADGSGPQADVAPDDQLPAAPLASAVAAPPAPSWLQGGAVADAGRAAGGPTDPGRRATARVWLERAEAAFTAGRWLDAERDFARAASEVAHSAPEYAAARLGQLRSLYGLARFVPARAVERELERIPGISTALEEARQGAEPQRGEALAAAALESLALARSQSAAADWPAAARNSEHALALAPGSLEAIVLLGRAQLELGRTSEAQSSFLRALALHPHSCQPSGWLAQVALREGRAADVRRHDRAYLARACDDREPGRASDAERRLEEPLPHE